MLLLHFSNFFPTWSIPSFPACFAPTPFHLYLPRLEQAALPCSLCSNLIFPTSSPFGAILLILLALLLLHFICIFPAWSKPPFPARFTPTPFFQLLSCLEQTFLSCSLYSISISPTTFLLGANLPFLLALLQSRSTCIFPTWSKPPFPAHFAPTPFHLYLSRLEQFSLSCSLCSNLILPTSSPLGANILILLALLLLHFTKRTLKVTNNKACSQHSCKPQKYVDACIFQSVHELYDMFGT